MSVDGIDELPGIIAVNLKNPELLYMMVWQKLKLVERGISTDFPRYWFLTLDCMLLVKCPHCYELANLKFFCEETALLQKIYM